MDRPTDDFVDHPLKESAEALALLKSITRQSKDLPGKLVQYYLAGSPMWETDFLVFAAAKRTMSLCEAFLATMRSKNFGAAAGLLRMQLDTSLRFSGLAHVADQQQYARRILGGEPINKMKAASGERLSDKFLSEALSKKLPWVRSVYVATSGFIHLSERHIFQTFDQVEEASRTVRSLISAEDVDRPAEDYLEILHAFDDSTKLACHLVESWLEQTRPRRAEEELPHTPNSYS